MSKVLLIEDDALLQRMYQKKLEMDGYQVLVAHDGEEGLAKFKSDKPDLVLLDVMMPKMNGYQVLESAKQDNEIKNTPVIMLTNLGSSDKDVDKGLELGAAAYLIKSNVRPADVVEKVKEILKASGADNIPQGVPVK